MKFLLVVIVLIALLLSIEAEITIVPPVIDISPLLHPHHFSAYQYNHVLEQIAIASQQWGFYHITKHGIAVDLQQQVLQQMDAFFLSPQEVKDEVRRTEGNSRGYANDELTKQQVDLKEIYDFGPPNDVLHFANISSQAKEDKKLDGVNFWPQKQQFPVFQNIIEEYYIACHQLALILMEATATALTTQSASVCSLPSPAYLKEAFAGHSSFLRLNYYPIAKGKSASGLGISRHTDAGALTILLQHRSIEHDDQTHDTPALEVYSGSKEDRQDGYWAPVFPVQRALTVNLGDMLQVWSNQRYKAPEHRVQASQQEIRKSVAYFLNPAYDTVVSPWTCDDQPPVYRPIRWGTFRSLRFQGDYADNGEEVQIEQYRVMPSSQEEL